MFRVLGLYRDNGEMETTIMGLYRVFRAYGLWV